MTENPPDVAARSEATPELIMQLGTSYMAARYLIAAVEVGVFEALGDDALDLDALAARIAIPRRTARICADAMVALGMLERHGSRYRNSPAAAAFLSGSGQGDHRPALRYAGRSFRYWVGLTDALQAGGGTAFRANSAPAGAA
jgi:Dimerisation domain